MHSADETGLRLLRSQLLDVVALRRTCEVAAVISAEMCFLITVVSGMSARGTYDPHFPTQGFQQPANKRRSTGVYFWLIFMLSHQISKY